MMSEDMDYVEHPMNMGNFNPDILVNRLDALCRLADCSNTLLSTEDQMRDILIEAADTVLGSIKNALTETQVYNTGGGGGNVTSLH